MITNVFATGVQAKEFVFLSPARPGHAGRGVRQPIAASAWGPMLSNEN